MKRERTKRITCGGAALAAVLAAAACGGSTERADVGVEPLPRASCGAVEYGGEGRADALIASDLPMRGAAQGRSEQMVEAIRLELESRDWRVGPRKVAFQACDDTDAKGESWDEGQCQDNARAYARDRALLGVVGTYNSGCAAAMLPILNRAPGGPVPMVSPGNTLICLTKPSGTCERSEPDRYRPSGSPSYARVVPTDAEQGAGLATFAEQRGLDRVFVLYAADDPTSRGQATTFTNAAKALGNAPVGAASWDPKGRDFRGLMERVRRARPDAVVLAGLTEQNGGRLIRDKVAVLGPNDRVALLAPDGFAQQSTIDEAGEASRGMFVSVPGRSAERLPPAGKQLAGRLRERLPGQPLELYAPYAAQATAVLLDAAEAGDGGRAATARALFGLQVRGGIVGDFEVDPAGDPTLAPITVSRAEADFVPVEEIVPRGSLVADARR